jgi:phage terminase small subunit
MPILKNARHERFAQNLAIGLDKTTAYDEAGYGRRCPQSAYKLSKDERIVARLRELQEKLAERFEVTAGKLIHRAELARILAMEIEQPAAAVSAIKEMGVLSGVRVAKREIVKPDASDLSDGELAEIARKGRGELDS